MQRSVQLLTDDIKIREFYDDLNKRARFSSLQEFNKFINSNKNANILKYLGIHSCIMAYIDPIDEQLYYLSDDSENTSGARSVKWPFHIDLVPEEDKWTKEKIECTSFRLKYSSLARFEGFGSGIETWDMLNELQKKGKKQNRFTPIEKEMRLLYAPMGEILTCVLGWYLRYFKTPQDIDIEEMHSLRIDASNDNINSQFSRTVSALNDGILTDIDRALMPTAFLYKTPFGKYGRHATWGNVFHDLGFIEYECSGNKITKIYQYRLNSLVRWLLSQECKNSNPILRPKVNLIIRKDMKEKLCSFEKTCEHKLSCEQYFEVMRIIIKILSPKEDVSEKDQWESLFNFNFVSHMIWMSAGRTKKSRWVSPYNWVAFDILREDEPETTDDTRFDVLRKTHGAAFLTFRPWGIEDGIVKKQLELIRQYTLTVGISENKHTYYRKIRKKHVERERDAKLAKFLSFFNPSFYHDFNNKHAILLTLLQYDSEAYEVADYMAEILSNYREDGLFDQDIIASVTNSNDYDEMQVVIWETLRWPDIKEFQKIKNIDLEASVHDLGNYRIKRSPFLRIAFRNILLNALKYCVNQKSAREKAIEIYLDNRSNLTIKNIIDQGAERRIKAEFSELTGPSKIDLRKWNEYSLLQTFGRRGIGLIISAFEYSYRDFNISFKIDKDNIGYQCFYVRLDLPQK